MGKIFTEHQLDLTKQTLGKFKQSHAMTKANPVATANWLHELELGGQLNWINKLQKQIDDYENVRDGKVKFESTYTLEEAKNLLADIRISKHVSQSDLAKAIGVRDRTLWQYEDSQYYEANRKTVIKAANALGITITN